MKSFNEFEKSLIELVFALKMTNLFKESKVTSTVNPETHE